MFLFISITLTIALIAYFLVKVLFPETVQEEISESSNNSTNSSIDFSDTNSIDQKDNDYNDEKRLNYITMKLYEAGSHFKSVANGILYYLAYLGVKFLLFKVIKSLSPKISQSVERKWSQMSIQEQIELGKKLNNAPSILGVLDFIITLFLIINVLWHLYEAASSLKSTKKYFQFNPDNISSRSKDPYFR
jgi:hypothetical protein